MDKRVTEHAREQRPESEASGPSDAVSPEGPATPDAKAEVARAEAEEAPEGPRGVPPEGPVKGAEEAPRETKNTVSSDEHLRLQAEFANFKKRTLRDQTRMVEQAAAKVIKDLLPVLDNFERAIAHGEGGEGVALVYKDFRKTLEQEGLEEIEAQGTAFDPELHDALTAIDDPEVDEPMVREVYQRGYWLNGRVIRHAKVVVSRPVEEASIQEPPRPSDEDPGTKE